MTDSDKRRTSTYRSSHILLTHSALQGGGRCCSACSTGRGTAGLGLGQGVDSSFHDWQHGRHANCKLDGAEGSWCGRARCNTPPRDLYVDSIEHSSRRMDFDNAACARKQALSPRKRHRDGDGDDANPRPSSKLQSSPDGAAVPTSPAHAGRQCSSSTPLRGASHTASASTAMPPAAPLGGAGSADAGCH